MKKDVSVEIAKEDGQKLNHRICGTLSSHRKLVTRSRRDNHASVIDLNGLVICAARRLTTGDTADYQSALRFRPLMRLIATSESS